MFKVTVENRTSTVRNHPTSLSVFLRLLRPLRYLADRGYISLLEATALDLRSKLGSGFDILVVNRPTQLQSLELIEQAKVHGSRVIVDVDDWMHGTPVYGLGLLQANEPLEAQRPYRSADLVTVPTSFVAQVLSPMTKTPPKIVPYGFDFDGLAPLPNRAAARTIMLSSMFTLKLGKALYEFSSAVRSFLDAHPDWELDFFCENFDAAPFAHPRITIRAPVSYPAYLEQLASPRYSFCIVPLSGYEDEHEIVFNACKSPVKFVDYSAHGLSGVYSRSPPYETVVEDGRNGLLVDNTYDAWLGALSEMAANAELRFRLASVSYEMARSRFSLELAAASLLDAIESTSRH